MGCRRWVRGVRRGRRAVRLPAPGGLHRRRARATALRRHHRLPRACGERRCRAGGRLGIYGFGASAHLAAQVALAEGATVHVMTRSPEARRLALRLGAASAGDTFDAPPEPLDSAIIFAPAGDIVPVALAAARSRRHRGDRRDPPQRHPVDGLRRSSVPGAPAAQRHRQHAPRRRGVPRPCGVDRADRRDRPVSLRQRRPGAPRSRRRSGHRRRRAPCGRANLRGSHDRRRVCRQRRRASRRPVTSSMPTAKTRAFDRAPKCRRRRVRTRPTRRTRDRPSVYDDAPPRACAIVEHVDLESDGAIDDPVGPRTGVAAEPDRSAADHGVDRHDAIPRRAPRAARRAGWRATPCTSVELEQLGSAFTARHGRRVTQEPPRCTVRSIGAALRQRSRTAGRRCRRARCARSGASAPACHGNSGRSRASKSSCIRSISTA